MGAAMGWCVNPSGESKGNEDTATTTTYHDDGQCESWRMATDLEQSSCEHGDERG